jgi:hypothetical protein
MVIIVVIWKVILVMIQIQTGVVTMIMQLLIQVNSVVFVAVDFLIAMM